MRHGSLFSGIGGFDLAAEWMGWENVFHCEWNDFGKRVLKYYWPNSISYNDIRKTDFTIHRGTIDILSGGFPCQPYSTAGKRKGKDDDRHLWPQMLRAIREIQPTSVVGENVRGLTNWNGGLVFDEVQADLEAEGYQVTPFLLPACAVNAPHRRDRIWFIAYNNKWGGQEHKLCTRRDLSKERTNSSGTTTNTGHTEPQGRNLTSQGQQHEGWGNTWSKPASLSSTWNVTNSNTQGLQKRIQSRKPGDNQTNESFQGSEFARTYSTDQWGQFPTQPPLCGRDDGLSRELDGITFPKWRTESLKGYGNAVVPQVAYQIFKAIESFNAK